MAKTHYLFERDRVQTRCPKCGGRVMVIGWSTSEAWTPLRDDGSFNDTADHDIAHVTMICEDCEDDVVEMFPGPGKQYICEWISDPATAGWHIGVVSTEEAEAFWAGVLGVGR